jgi:hypothetical protein
MRHGDKDGYSEIYDDNGELILHPNERKLVIEENVVPTLKSTWRYYGGDYLLEPSKGTMVLTNERMVFINIPERMFAIGGGEEARAMSASMEKSFELGDLSSGSVQREYFEIPNIEVMASERKEGAVSVGVMVNVYILSSGNQFHLSMVLTEDSDLLKRLMNKRVDNLDELVNNLKDYFRKTEWMFTEQERKFYKDVDLSVPEGTGKDFMGGMSQEIPAVPSSPKKTLEPSSTFDPKIPQARIGDRVGQKSVEYFNTLFRKGLIKEEIFRRLMSQYGIDADIQISNPFAKEGVSPDNGSSTSVESEGGVPDGEMGESDDELLGLLDDTLADFSDDVEEAEPVTNGEDTLEEQDPTVGETPDEDVVEDVEPEEGEAEVQDEAPEESKPKKRRVVRRKAK